MSTPTLPEETGAVVPSGDAQASPAREGRTADTQRLTFTPTQITLTRIGHTPVSSAVEQIDTLPNGQLGLPVAAGAVGWWRSGALAGEAFGSVVLAGHIDTPSSGVGYFAKLLQMRPGDSVALRDGSRQQAYRILSSRNVAKASLASGTDTFSQSVLGRLVLLTCTGRFDPKTHHYDQNLVVIADPIGLTTTVN